MQIEPGTHALDPHATGPTPGSPSTSLPSPSVEPSPSRGADAASDDPPSVLLLSGVFVPNDEQSKRRPRRSGTTNRADDRATTADIRRAYRKAPARDDLDFAVHCATRGRLDESSR